MVKFLEHLGEGYIDIIETSYEDIKGSLRLARRYYLNYVKLWDDLIIAYQMKRLNINEVYSNDSDFNEIPGIKRLF